uniref:Uncharacterized protein n=1 Tax=Phlebotomus papatasi TaxID=29031 RepID=A0A1B0D1Q9_PHLPP
MRKDCVSPPLKPSVHLTLKELIEMLVMVQLCTWSGRPAAIILLEIDIVGTYRRQSSCFAWMEAAISSTFSKLTVEHLGIIVQWSVLQGVSRSTAGNYSCVGFNAEGEDAPSCAPNQTRIYGVAKQENAQIKCTVEANPPEVEFRWTFNNSAESIDVAGGHVSRFGTSSSVLYTPMTELDYGTLMCQATNKIGRQKGRTLPHNQQQGIIISNQSLSAQSH